jgi:hypothetical protein
LLTPLAGMLLDYSHHSVNTVGVQHYSMENYTFALSIIPISLVLCLVLMHFIKETGSASEEEERSREEEFAKLTS